MEIYTSIQCQFLKNGVNNLRNDNENYLIAKFRILALKLLFAEKF